MNYDKLGSNVEFLGTGEIKVVYKYLTGKGLSDDSVLKLIKGFKSCTKERFGKTQSYYSSKQSEAWKYFTDHYTSFLFKNKITDMNILIHRAISFIENTNDFTEKEKNVINDLANEENYN